MFFGLSWELVQTWFTSQFTQCILIMWWVWIQFWLSKSNCRLAQSLWCTRGALGCVHSTTTQQLLVLVCLKLLAIIVKHLQLASDLRYFTLARNLNPKSISQRVYLSVCVRLRVLLSSGTFSGGGFTSKFDFLASPKWSVFSPLLCWVQGKLTLRDIWGKAPFGVG